MGTQELSLVLFLGQKIKDINFKSIWVIVVINYKEKTYSVVMVLLGHTSWRRRHFYRFINNRKLDELFR